MSQWFLYSVLPCHKRLFENSACTSAFFRTRQARKALSHRGFCGREKLRKWLNLWSQRAEQYNQHSLLPVPCEKICSRGTHSALVRLQASARCLRPSPPLHHFTEAFVTSRTLCTHGPLPTAALSLTALSLTKAPLGDCISGCTRLHTPLKARGGTPYPLNSCCISGQCIITAVTPARPSPM